MIDTYRYHFCCRFGHSDASDRYPSCFLQVPLEFSSLRHWCGSERSGLNMSACFKLKKSHEHVWFWQETPHGFFWKAHLFSRHTYFERWKSSRRLLLWALEASKYLDPHCYIICARCSEVRDHWKQSPGRVLVHVQRGWREFVFCMRFRSKVPLCTMESDSIWRGEFLKFPGRYK